MTFQYGDLRVDQITYTSGGVNSTVTVSGLVQQVEKGGTTKGNVTIEGNLTVTGRTTVNTITGNTANFTTGNFRFISGEDLHYTRGTISGLFVKENATITGTTSGTTFTGTNFSGVNGVFQNLSGQTISGGNVIADSGVFTFLSGQTITGDTIRATSGIFNSISGDSLVIRNLTFTGGGSIKLPDTITGESGVFTFLSGTTITGDTISGTTGTFQRINVEFISGNNAQFAGNVFVTGTLSGATVSGGRVLAATGDFDVITGPIASTTATGVTRVATSLEAQSAVAPSGTYEQAISGDANSPFLVNPSGLSSAFRSYDPPVGTSAGTQVFARVVVTTGISPDFSISGVTWSGISLAANAEAVTDLEATSAVRPSGTYGVTASGTATSQDFYNPVQLEKTFKAYDPVATAAETQLYARKVSGTSDGGGGFDTGDYGWVELPTSTFVIATAAQASGAAANSGTYSATPTAADAAQVINPFRLRQALQAYDPGPVAGQTRMYARQISGFNATTATGQTWVDITDTVNGNFLPLSGGTVTGDVTVSGTLSVSGGNVLHVRDNGTAAAPSIRMGTGDQRGFFVTTDTGVGVSVSGQELLEIAITGDVPFAFLSGALRVGGNNTNVSNTNTSQFWAFDDGHFVAASSANGSQIWKDALTGPILELQSNVGGVNRVNVFEVNASGAIGVSGAFGDNGQVLTSRGTNSGVVWTTLPGGGGTDGEFDNLQISGDVTITGDLRVSGTSIFNTITVTGQAFDAVSVSGGVMASGGVVFGTVDTDGATRAKMGIYLTAENTAAPNLIISETGIMDGAATRNSIAIGTQSQFNASSNSDRNISIGNSALGDMTDGEKNVAIGHSAMQNVRPGNNQGFNTALGDQAMFGNTNASNSCRENVSVGANSMQAVLNARENVAVGREAMRRATTATGNTAIGFQALPSGTNCNNNTVVGITAGGDLTTGGGNTLIGAEAGHLLTTGIDNTIIGRIEGDAGLSSGVIIAAGATERLRITNRGNVQIPNNSEASIILRRNGSASFASGEVTIASGGDTVISGSLQVGPNTVTHEAGTTQQNESLVTATLFNMASGSFYCISGAIAVPNPTNQLAGQAGIMRLITAAPASFADNFRFPGGGTPTITGITATTNAIIPFYVPASGTIMCGTPIMNISGTNSLGTQVDRV